MSDFKVSNIQIFPGLSRSISSTCTQAPQLLSGVLTKLEELQEDLLIDRKETEQKLVDLKNQIRAASAAGGRDNGLNAKMSQLQRKLNLLKSAESKMQHLLQRITALLAKSHLIASSAKKADAILTQIGQVASKYLQLSLHSNNSSTDISKHSGTTYVAPKIRVVGDTFHYSKENSISQMLIDQISRDVKQSGVKGNKISIDNISQLDFSVLEKNGFTISKIGPNQYSAFKDL